MLEEYAEKVERIGGNCGRDLAMVDKHVKSCRALGF